MRKGCNSELWLSTFVIVLDHSQMAGHCCQVQPSTHRMILKVSSPRVFQNLSCKSDPEHHGDFYTVIHKITVAEPQMSSLVSGEKGRAEEIALLGSLLLVFKSGCQADWWFLLLEIRTMTPFKMKVNIFV